jgi:hypothetical protein
MSQPQEIEELKDFIIQSHEIYTLLEKNFTAKSSVIFTEIKKLVNKVRSFNKNKDVMIEISNLITEWENEKPDIILESFRNGVYENKVYDLIQDELDSGPLEEEQIRASGSYGEFFICICKVGPLYLIRANEFDDILWFCSKEDALSHAKEEYSDFIDEDSDIEYYCEKDEIYTFIQKFRYHFHDVEDIAHHLDGVILNLLSNRNFMKTFNDSGLWDPISRKYSEPTKEDIIKRYLEKLTEEEIISCRNILKKNNGCKEHVESHQKLIEDLMKFITLYNEDESLRILIVNMFYD